ncbi:MAG: metal-dependent transcriptional regulator [bacterium]|nr:metal-dependent transcriptional regulator [Candidatus Aquidulcis sp.]
MVTTRRAALTSAAQEYLLAFRSHGDEAGVTPSLIAKDLAVSKQAAAEMFRRLADDRLIAPCSGHARLWRLTASGESAADAVFRRHALLEWLLTSVIGMPWAAADVEARRLHAAISPEFETRLDDLIGHPQTCPHGNPIDRATESRRPKGEPLAALEAGEAATIYRVTEAAEADAALLSYLEARGLVPGAKITVLSRSASLDSLTLDGPIGRASLGLRPAGLVHVLRGSADAALFHQIPLRR